MVSNCSKVSCVGLQKVGVPSTRKFSAYEIFLQARVQVNMLKESDEILIKIVYMSLLFFFYLFFFFFSCRWLLPKKKK